MNEQTYYRWKKKYGELGISELRRLQQLEEENRTLKQMVADLALDKHVLQEVLSINLRILPESENWSGIPWTASG